MSEVREKHMVESEIVVATQCDNCSKREANLEMVEKEWFYFSDGHNGWGNDSVDSFHEFNVCSAKCFIGILPKLIKDMDNHRGAEIAEMPVAFAKQLLELVK